MAEYPTLKESRSDGLTGVDVFAVDDRWNAPWAIWIEGLIGTGGGGDGDVLRF